MFSSLPRRSLVRVLVLLSCATNAVAQDPATPPLSAAWARLERYQLGVAYPGSQLKDYVYARSARHFARGDAERDAIKTPEALRTRQTEIRRFVQESVGGLPPSDARLYDRKNHLRIAAAPLRDRQSVSSRKTFRPHCRSPFRLRPSQHRQTGR